MSFTRQFLALLAMSLAGIPRRLGSVLTILIGVSCAVGVLVSMLAMSSGAHSQALGNVSDDRVVITSLGARGIESSIPRDEAGTIRNLPGLKIGSDGKPMMVLQSIVPIEGRRRPAGTRGFFLLIGVTDSPLRDARPEMRGFIHDPTKYGHGRHLMESILNERNLRRMLKIMLDEREFLSPFGIRALSRYHAALMMCLPIVPLYAFHAPTDVVRTQFHTWRLPNL